MRGFERMEDGPRRDKDRNGRQIQSKGIVYTRETPKIINKMGIFLKRNGFDSIFLTLWPHGHRQVIQPLSMSFYSQLL